MSWARPAAAGAALLGYALLAGGAVLGAGVLSGCSTVLGLDEFGSSGSAGGAGGSGGSASSSGGAGGAGDYDCAPECEPQLLASAQAAKYLTLDGEQIYWDESGMSGCVLHLMDKDGEAFGPIDNAPCAAAGAGPIHVASESAFWLAGAALRKVAGPQFSKLQFATNVRHFTYDNAYIYYVDSAGRVHRNLKDTMDPAEMLLDQMDVREALVDQSRLWLTGSLGPQDSLIAVSQLEPLTKMVMPLINTREADDSYNLTAGHDRLYWIGAGGSIFYANQDIDNRPSVQVLNPGMEASRIALYGEYLYWGSKSDAQIYRFSVIDEDVHQLTTSLTEPPFDLAVDADGIFWTDSFGVRHIAP